VVLTPQQAEIQTQCPVIMRAFQQASLQRLLQPHFQVVVVVVVVV